MKKKPTGKKDWAMKIALASQSEMKIETLRKAFAGVAGFELAAFSTPSGVNEQPTDEETFKGAANRIAFIRAACPDADLYVSIENGLFKENDIYMDRAVVTIATNDGKTQTTLSEGVAFPAKYVEATRNRDGGLARWTVGKTMAEAGIVKNHADPHIDLCGKSRSEIINETLAEAVKKLDL